MKGGCSARWLAVLGLFATAASAFAGRPLSVDDAGINNPGEGHVELWSAHADGATSWNISPAYAITRNIEVAAAYSSVNVGGLRSTTLQGKWLITPSRDEGCNGAASVGYVHARSDFGGSSGSYLNGIFSCNGMDLGNVHFNLGYVKPNGASGSTTWGIALEKALGAITPHIEAFGAERQDTTVQVGARGDIAKNLQLDGTFGRVAGTNVYSLGLKLRF